MDTNIVYKKKHLICVLYTKDEGKKMLKLKYCIFSINRQHRELYISKWVYMYISCNIWWIHIKTCCFENTKRFDQCL